MADCRICGTKGIGSYDIGAMPVFQCSRCGDWTPLPPAVGEPQRSLLDWLSNWEDPASALRRSRLSHLVRQQQRSGSMVGVPLGRLQSWGLDDPLPKPATQVDNLVLWIGAQQPSYAEGVVPDIDAVSARIGAPIDRSDRARPLQWLLDTAEKAGLLNYQGISLEAELTIRGWSRYEELLRNVVVSSDAFMAMKFGDGELDRVVDGWFKPAVARAGFSLRRITEGQAAGLIDDQMRVAIRTSKFVVADLTHQNDGAYWEAGFAEGLARPVIYTCRKAEWDRKLTHFDTNHLVTVVWDPDDLADAADRLTATIRATLPADAKMMD